MYNVTTISKITHKRALLSDKHLIYFFRLPSKVADDYCDFFIRIFSMTYGIP